MKKRLIIIALGSIIYSILTSFMSNDLDYTNFIAQFLIPIIPSLILAFLTGIFFSSKEKKSYLETFTNHLYKIWIIVIILFTIGNLSFYSF